MKGENSRLPHGRKLIQEMSVEQRDERQREALSERERLRKDRAARRDGRWEPTGSFARARAVSLPFSDGGRGPRPPLGPGVASSFSQSLGDWLPNRRVVGLAQTISDP